MFFNDWKRNEQRLLYFRYDYSAYDYSYDANSAAYPTYPGYEASAPYTATGAYDGYAGSATYPTSNFFF